MRTCGRRERGCRRGRGGRARGRREREYILQEIKEKVEELIATLSEDEICDLLRQVVERDPGLMFDLLKASRTNPSCGYHLRPRPGDKCPGWCTCSNCREMPTGQEKVCCMQTPEDCISSSNDFELNVLYERVIPSAKQFRSDVFVIKNYNKAKRQESYRRFTLWRYGRLGAGIRIVIPSCCVWKIRDKFPDPFKHYTGFRPSRLG